MMLLIHSVVVAAFCIFCIFAAADAGSKDKSDAERLYDDLVSESSGYNTLVRPTGNNTDTLTVKLGLRLWQLIDVDEKNQIMTSKVWLDHEWYDLSLSWKESDYGGVDRLYVPSDKIWLPDIVLYNNADGDYEVTIKTKATLHSDGKVLWKPPAIYKSSCSIDVEFFPFDEQSCKMKFSSWTYDSFQVDLQHMNQSAGETGMELEDGIDMSDYDRSVQWDILRVPVKRTALYYDCCPEPYTDITFRIHMRRKALFYTVNLIIPCVAISFLSVLVFYLPSDSGEKITLCISILLSLTVFILLLNDIIPPTSLVIPLMGKYLLFTMIMVTLSVIISVVVINIHNRSPSMHTIPPWVHRVFLNWLPRLLCMRRPNSDGNKDESLVYNGFRKPNVQIMNGNEHISMNSRYISAVEGPEMTRAIDDIIFVAEHLRSEDEESEVQEDWKYVAMVLDRLFLWLFTIACLLGTFGIILKAPTLYDDRPAIA